MIPRTCRDRPHRRQARSQAAAAPQPRRDPPQPPPGPVPPPHRRSRPPRHRTQHRAERARLTRLAREGQRQPWWHSCSDLLTPVTGQYLDLETAATTIRTYSPSLIPDLLQTPAYATAAIKATRPDLSTSAITKLVTLQARRQERLARARSTLHAILASTAITNPIAPAHVMTDQPTHLIAATTTPGITVQLTSPATRVISPAFSLLTFTGEPSEPGISSSCAPAGQVVIDRKRGTATATRALFDALTRSARAPGETAALLREAQH